MTTVLPPKAELAYVSSLGMIKIHLDLCHSFYLLSATLGPLWVRVWLKNLGLRFVLEPCAWFSVCVAGSDVVG